MRSKMFSLLLVAVGVAFSAVGYCDDCAGSDVDKNGVVDDGDLLKVLMCFGSQIRHDPTLPPGYIHNTAKMAVSTLLHNLGYTPPPSGDNKITVHIENSDPRSTRIFAIVDGVRDSQGNRLPYSVIADIAFKSESSREPVVYSLTVPTSVRETAGGIMVETLVFGNGGRTGRGMIYAAETREQLMRLLPRDYNFEIEAIRVRAMRDEDHAGPETPNTAKCTVTLATGGCSCWIDTECRRCGYSLHDCCRSWWCEGGRGCNCVRGEHVAVFYGWF